MTIIGIDPGPVQSAYVVWDGKEVLAKDTCDNGELLEWIPAYEFDEVVIEKVAWSICSNMAQGSSSTPPQRRKDAPMRYNESQRRQHYPSTQG